MKATNEILEAERYIQNARQILSEKAGKDGEYYTDRKYVKLAGHAAWCGVLIAIDAALNVKKRPEKRPEKRSKIRYKRLSRGCQQGR